MSARYVPSSHHMTSLLLHFTCLHAFYVYIRMEVGDGWKTFNAMKICGVRRVSLDAKETVVGRSGSVGMRRSDTGSIFWG